MKNLSPTKTSELLGLLLQKHERELEESLVAYVREAWTVLEPGHDFVPGWHIDLICEYLTAVTQGAITRLLITVPPRHMKSLLVSVIWPTWTWVKRPELRWMFASYAASLSVKHSVDRRALIESPWYQGFWSDRFRLTDDQNEKAEFSNTQRGTMVATSIGGSATGKGGDLIIVDDPHNPTQAESDTQREEAIRFFDQTLMTRLDDPDKGAMVVIMQRLHERDLVGHLLERGGWEHLSLPAEAESPERVVFPISQRAVERQPGELLWPERFSRKFLDDQKRALGSYAFAGQYQQRPSPAEGGIIKRSWWRYYAQAPARFDMVVISCDCAFKATDHSDFVVLQVWGAVGANKYLLDQARGRLTFTETVNGIRSLSSKWPSAGAKLVEDSANGPAVIDVLHSTISGLIAIKPQGGKMSRAQAISADIEAGNVHLPDPSVTPWVGDFVEECAAFPKGPNDDQVDAMSQGVVYIRENTGQDPGFYFTTSSMYDYVPNSQVDREELWERAMRGVPMSEEDIRRL